MVGRSPLIISSSKAAKKGEVDISYSEKGSFLATNSHKTWNIIDQLEESFKHPEEKTK
jgi:hypothetical protein